MRGVWGPWEEAAGGCLCEIALEHLHRLCSVLKSVLALLSCEEHFPGSGLLGAQHATPGYHCSTGFSSAVSAHCTSEVEVIVVPSVPDLMCLSCGELQGVPVGTKFCTHWCLIG